MSSNFSNLKFELIGTGEQSGFWGATTNTNIGTAIEQAIVGMATLTSADFAANVATLTLANTNAAQNARALCLNIAAGAVSAAGTINVPAIEKPYLIINNSSFTVTVKVSGLTGVAVPAGRRTVVYNDGTDVGEQVTYLTNLLLGSASISGTLAVSGALTASSSVTATGILNADSALIETQVAVAASDINLSLANCFTKTITATTAFTVSNVPTSGNLASFILNITNGGAFSVSWWATVKWPSGASPTLTVSGRDVLGFFTYDGGVTWTGLVLGKDVK
jgi:hypothetical protein